MPRIWLPYTSTCNTYDACLVTKQTILSFVILVAHKLLSVNTPFLKFHWVNSVPHICIKITYVIFLGWSWHIQQYNNTTTCSVVHFALMASSRASKPASFAIFLRGADCDCPSNFHSNLKTGNLLMSQKSTDETCILNLAKENWVLKLKGPFYTKDMANDDLPSYPGFFSATVW